MSAEGFVALKRFIQEEAALRGERLSSRKAHSMARTVMLRNIDEDDYANTEGGKRLIDLNFHSDPTAREAVRRWMDTYFNNIMKGQAA